MALLREYRRHHEHRDLINTTGDPQARLVTDEMLRAQADRVAECCDRLTHKRVAILGDPVGTGKTAVALVTANLLIDAGMVEHVLISAPNAQVATQWQQRSESLPHRFETPASHTSGYSQKPRQVRSRGGGAGGPRPKEPSKTLVIVDEAHKGLQNDDNVAYEKFRELARECMVLFVTATPMQLSVQGLQTMLSAADPAIELNKVKRYHRALHRVLTETNHEDSDHEVGGEPDERLAPLKRESERQLSEYLLSSFDRERAGVGTPASLDADCVNGRGTSEWTLGYQVARILPEILDVGKGDMFQRRLISSTRAFWNGTAGSALREQTDGKPDKSSKLLATLRHELNIALGTDADHPKVQKTVAWVIERLRQDRKVVVFCVFHETRDVLTEILRASDLVQRDQITILAPTSTAAFRTQGAAFQEAERAVIVLTDRFSESVDLDGGRPCIVHHDLTWSPIRLDQRLGRIVRISTGFEQPAAEDVYVPILDVEVDRRLFKTASDRGKLIQKVLDGRAGVELSGVMDEDGSDHGSAGVEVAGMELQDQGEEAVELA